MDREKFNLLFRDIVVNIHDPAVLEKHAANSLFPLIDRSASRAENLRRYINEGIESLKPADKAVNLETLEWRYYLILTGRYIEGESFVDIQKRLALGERQVRRLHGRALDALENILWDRLFPDAVMTAAPVGQEEMVTGTADSDYPVLLEPLPLDRIVQEAAGLCLPRIRARGGDLELHFASGLAYGLPMVQSDRVILRQILLDMFNRVLQVWVHGSIRMILRSNPEAVICEIQANVDSAAWAAEKDWEQESPIGYWVDRLNASLSREEETAPTVQGTVPVRYTLALSRAKQATIYVVDDHEPAIRIIQRYLSHSNVQVVGITDPTQVLSLAKSAHPQAILLDVMMPAVDGWEILQQLKSDPETQQIAVIVCSVWEQPDLAFSLGANGFLKKPINQAELIGELSRLSSLDIAGG